MEDPNYTLKRKAIWLLWKGLTATEVAKSTGLSYYYLTLAKNVFSKPLPKREGLSVNMPAIRSIH